MSNTFFLPVGKTVHVHTIVNGLIRSGELAGLINVGGIPAIWLKAVGTDYIILLNNVATIDVINENKPLINLQ